VTATSRASRRTTAGVGFIAVLTALNAFGPLSNDTYLPGLPRLTSDLGASASAGAATLTAVLVGLAFGQLVLGPVSDSYGRRRPLFFGIGAFALTSLLCAAAPNIWALIVLRLLQGMAGGTGIVIARAIVRDLHEGAAAARYFGMLMLVQAIAPIVAPLLGALILYFTSWRGIFVALAAIGLVLLTAVAWRLPETLAPEDRHGTGLEATLATFRRLLGEREFVGYLFANALPFATMFAYIAGSPFVLQDIYGLSPQEFAFVFGTNALGIGVLGFLSSRSVHRFGPTRLLAVGLSLSALGGAAVLVCALAGTGLAPVLVSFFISVSAVGLVLPNASALALKGHPSTAGSASALLGLTQFLFGALVAPIIGVAGRSSAVPLGIVMASLGVLSVLSFSMLVVLPAGRSSRVR
jgi:MFS transporter, DHA1 family, multidrug resistance protein